MRDECDIAYDALLALPPRYRCAVLTRSMLEDDEGAMTKALAEMLAICIVTARRLPDSDRLAFAESMLWEAVRLSLARYYH